MVTARSLASGSLLAVSVAGCVAPGHRWVEQPVSGLGCRPELCSEADYDPEAHLYPPGASARAPRRLDHTVTLGQDGAAVGPVPPPSGLRYSAGDRR